MSYIAIEHGLGKLHLSEPPATYVPERMRGVTSLPVEHAHALAVATLPAPHRDPFDRLLVALASLLAIPLVSADVVPLDGALRDRGAAGRTPQRGIPVDSPP